MTKAPKTLKTKTMASIEDDAESISRLAQAVWLIGQLLLEDDHGFEVGPPLKQLAEEIRRYTKLVHDAI